MNNTGYPIKAPMVKGVVGGKSKRIIFSRYSLDLPVPTVSGVRDKININLKGDRSPTEVRDMIVRELDTAEDACKLSTDKHSDSNGSIPFIERAAIIVVAILLASMAAALFYTKVTL